MAAESGTKIHATMDIPTYPKASVCTPVVDRDGTVQSSAAHTKTQTSHNTSDKGCCQSIVATEEGKTTCSSAEIHTKIDIPIDKKASNCPPVANADGTLQAPAADTKTQTSQNAVEKKLRDTSAASYVGTNGALFPGVNHQRKLSTLPLIFLIFYGVSGGPFAIEDTVRAAGPLLALLGFLVFPLVWSIPEALITAEMSTMYPENGGYVVWVSAALGPFWGFEIGWMKWIGGVIDNALYPAVFLDYLKSGIPVVGSGLPRVMAEVGLTILQTYLNYRGLIIVGWFAVVLGIFSLLPFVVMGFISIPKLRPERWFALDIHNVDWNLYLNTAFWNLNYWDSISTVAGEVGNPKKTMPKALFYAVIVVVLGYLFPLLTGTGAIPLDRKSWTDGHLADVAKLIAGVWLSWWIQGAAAMANMGMFVTEISNDSFQLHGMAERGMLPEFFARRSRYGTPLAGILFSASGVLLVSSLSIQERAAVENFLYCFAMIVEFIAFVRIRFKAPAAPRPFKIPVGKVGAILMCIPPMILLIVVLVVSSLKVFLISLVAIVVGLILQPCLKHTEKKKWLRFSTSSDLPDIHDD